MNINTPRAARAFLLAAMPLCAVAATTVTATAQDLRSSVTSFDRFGNAIIQETQADPTRSSVTSFDKQGNAIITYTSPPVVPNKIGVGTAPNPNPGLYNRYNYNNTQAYRPGYFNPNYNYNYNYPQYNYGYPAPVYPPAYPVQGQAYVSGFGNGNSTTIIPLGPDYAYGAPTYPYPAAPYGYPVPAYNYPVPAYPYGYGNGYNNGYGYGTYNSNTAGYGVTFGRGGFSASIGGSNTTSRSSTVITVR